VGADELTPPVTVLSIILTPANVRGRTWRRGSGRGGARTEDRNRIIDLDVQHCKRGDAGLARSAGVADAQPASAVWTQGNAWGAEWGVGEVTRACT
jgi:hypothetical protein